MLPCNKRVPPALLGWKSIILTILIFQDTRHVSSNMETINFWSLLHLAMLLIVGFTQVHKLVSYQNPTSLIIDPSSFDKNFQTFGYFYSWVHGTREKKNVSGPPFIGQKKILFIGFTILGCWILVKMFKIFKIWWVKFRHIWCISF